MKPKPTHGGNRPGAGRKPTGKTTVSRTVSMPARTWAALDDARGAQPRGIFIAGMMAKKTAVFRRKQSFNNGLKQSSNQETLSVQYPPYPP